MAIFCYVYVIWLYNECGIRSVMEDIHAYSEGLLRRPSEYDPIQLIYQKSL